MSKRNGTAHLSKRARDIYAATRDEAVQFAERAQAAAQHPRPAEHTATDHVVARALRRLGDKGAEQVAAAERHLRAAAWLPERPTLTSILLQRGVISQKQVQMIQQSQNVQNAQGNRQQPSPAQNINTRYGRVAVQAGYVTGDQVQWALNRIPDNDRGKLVLPTMLTRQGLLSQQQHEQIVRALKTSAPLGKPQQPATGKLTGDQQSSTA